MEQRDYILREIEKISTLVLGMLGKLKAITKPQQFEQQKEALFSEFQNKSGISIDMILAADADKLGTMLSKEKGFDSYNIDILSELLFEFSFNVEEEERKTCILKAIMLLEWVAAQEKTFDLEREKKLSYYRSEL